MAHYKSIMDERIIAVGDYVTSNKVKGIKSTAAYLKSIGAGPSNIHNIKAGKQSFAIIQILNCCTLYNISADYIFGFTDDMFRKTLARPIDKLKAAVLELEEQMKFK